MKKILLIFILLLNPFIALAEINECKTDVYFANGILTEEDDAEYNALEILKPAIIDLLGQEPFTQKIGKVSYAYNNTIGFWSDGIETVLQKFGWMGLRDSLGDVHASDVQTQITAYKESIKDGHKVLAVVHSQGNLFTYEALRGLDPWMQDYFEAVSIASPMSEDIKYGTPRIDWDNDPVPRIATLGNELPWMTSNSVRKVSWESNNVFGSGKPNADYVVKSELGKTYNKGGYSYLAEEAGIDLPNAYVHAFTFYMGETLKDSDGKTEIINPFTGTTLTDTTAKTKIMNAVATKLGILPDNELGIINISLKWDDANVAMNLKSEIGKKNISRTACNSIENYYVESEDDVSVGIYGVYVSHLGSVDAAYLPQNVTLEIRVPGKKIKFDFKVTDPDMLNIGHVADIIITKNFTHVMHNASIHDFKNPNNNGGGGNQNSGISVDLKCDGDCTEEIEEEILQGYLYEIQSRLKQALLGPLSAADITLTKAENFLNNVAFYESSTSGDNSLLTSGIFYFTNEVLKSLESDTYYVMSVIGGDDIDADDNGKLDLIPTKNLGSIHAIVDADTITHKNFKVNVLTEIAFQLTQEMLNEELDTTALQEKLDDIATRLLIADVDGDEEINYKDLLAWVPIGDKEKLRKPYGEFYEPIVQKIYKNQAIYDDAYALAYESFYRTQFFHVDEKAVSGKIVGKIELELSNEASYSLTQENDFFEILHDGTIIVKDSAVLDHGINKSVVLHVQIVTKEGKSITEEILISVNNIPEVAPTLRDIILTVNTDLNIGTIIGNILQDSGDTPIIAMQTSPSSPFTVDLNGNIRVNSSLLEAFENSNSFVLKTEATNSFGKSNAASLNISLTNIGFAVDLLDTNIAIDLYQELGSQVGTLQINYNKEAPIEQIELLGEYAFMFETDITGAIYLKENYQVGIPLSFVLSSRISNRYGVSDTKNVTIDFFSKEPYIFGLEANVDENSVGGTLVGSVPIITHGETLISSWKLSGNGSDKFTIENDGTIRVAHGANLDYETRSSYELSLQAFNEFGASYKKTVLININDLIDPPTLYNTFLEVEEHRPINTLLGQIDFVADSNCKISSFNVNKESDTIESVENNVFIDSAGEVYSAMNTTFDYEKKRSDYYSVYANTECGQSNTVGLHIDVIDLDENGIVQLNSELKLNSAYISIQKIEANGDTNEVFRHYVTKETFNTHKFELEPDSFYIYEFSGGHIYKNNAYQGRFQGRLRTIVKGSWMTEIERLRITPVSEAIVARLLEQKPILDPKTLEDDLENLAKEYIHEDIDYDGTIDILDVIAVDISTINDPYAFMQETTFIVRDDILSPMNLGALNTISINNGSLQTIELSGEGSEHFEVNENNELILTSSYNDMDQNSYIFEVKSIDILGHKSVANISVTFDPSIYLHSSYETNSYIYKIAASKEQEILFEAAGEDGVMVFTTQYQNLNLLTFYNTQTNAHIFAPNSKIVALTTYLYGEQEILFALNQTTSSLEIIDVTFPEIPVRLSTLALRDFSDIEADLVISADGKYAYTAGAYLEKINIENLTSPLIMSDLDLLAEMPYAKQFYIQEEMFGIITLKTWDETYVTYFIDTNNELSFMKDEIMPQELWIEYRPYAKILQKNMLGYTLKWDELIVLSLRERDLYDVVNKSKLNDKSFGNMNDLSFSKYEEYLYIVSTNGKIGMVGFRAQEE